jgi:PAS domain S-box-containing protein
MAKARIMVVEDEGIIAEDIQMSLQDLGYEVSAVVATGEEAVSKAHQVRPDLVLMDIVLQGSIDGIEAATRIRSGLDIPIIYLTAYADDKMLERAKTTAPFAYMIKPFRERELRTNIEMALFKHELDAKLRESQQWFSGTLNSLGDAVIATDIEGLVRYMNPVAQQLTGLSQSAALSKPLAGVFRVEAEKTREPVGDLVKTLVQLGKPTSLSERSSLVLVANGRSIIIDAGGAPIRNENGRILGVVLVFRDITARKEAEAHLRLLSAAVEQASEGIGVTDLTGRFLFLNKAFAELHGFSPDEAAGKHVSLFHTEEQMPHVREAHEEVTSQGVFSGELEHMRADGTTFPGLMHNALLKDDENEPIGVIATLRDISDIKAAHAALEKSHQELEAYSTLLEARVRERTRDLEESRKELERYSESLEKTNEALKIVIQGIEEQKREVEKKITHNLNLTVKPILDHLKSQDVPDAVHYLIESLEFNLTNMLSSFGMNIMQAGQKLTPREIRICEMIRSGLTSKQMAKVMEISPYTILVHRKNIRKKLGIVKAKQNLASYLKANL